MFTPPPNQEKLPEEIFLPDDIERKNKAVESSRITKAREDAMNVEDPHD